MVNLRNPHFSWRVQPGKFCTSRAAAFPDNLMIIALFLVVGLVALVFGGDLLVKGAERLAEKLGVSPMLIGLTIVGFGTSTPELVTSLQAAFAGSPGISVGNVVGSNIANILLILGATSLIAVIPVNGQTFRRDSMALILSALLCLAVVLSGELARWTGILLVLALFGYLGWCIYADKAQASAGGPTLDLVERPKGSFSLYAGMFLGGLILTMVGAHFFVRGAIDLATGLGVSDTIIGLTVVAVGTSLPELVASIAAALRKQTAIALGNIVGSNIFNILFILGATAIVHPIPVADVIARFDIWIMLAATAGLVVAGLAVSRIGRLTGFAFLAGYAAYTGYLVADASGMF